MKAELEHAQKTLKMMNSGTSKLDHILTMGKANGDHYGLGFSGKGSTSKTVFVKEQVTQEPQPVIGKRVSDFQ
ncbi:hypothetical protein L484_004877 [Morus notabilis]|uniref:Uncharacterized protein n=1 Tax=Morus notabilis TaxID=981085 RepID=W9RH05_9ROSA|nr:hypothetical protein L484_004877 [Morus notabilis]